MRACVRACVRAACVFVWLLYVAVVNVVDNCKALCAPVRKGAS